MSPVNVWIYTERWNCLYGFIAAFLGRPSKIYHNWNIFRPYFFCFGGFFFVSVTIQSTLSVWIKISNFLHKYHCMPVCPFHQVDLVQEPASVVDLKVKKTNEKLKAVIISQVSCQNSNHPVRLYTQRSPTNITGTDSDTIKPVNPHQASRAPPKP